MGPAEPARDVVERSAAGRAELPLAAGGAAADDRAGRTGATVGRARRREAASLALAALALAGCQTARPAKQSGPPPGWERRAFEIPGDGVLELAIPKDWSAEESPATEDAPPTIRLERAGEFLALLTPFSNPGEPAEATGADTAQLFAELARRKALAGSVEREIALEELVGDGVHGYWFSATDRELAERSPGAEEWRHVIQGAASVGDLVVAFTLLDNADGPQRGALLDAVRGARHVPDVRARPGGEAPELDPDAETAPLAVPAPGGSWSVLVDLPGFRMLKAPEPGEGGRHVLGQHPESGIVASVLLRPAGRARDAAGCRAADLARVRDATSLSEVHLSEAAPAARANYTLTGVRGAAVRQEHGHAWLHRDGVCANVHVSKMAPGPGDLEAIERILDSVRFGEEL